jgi:hypothetical protein
MTLSEIIVISFGVIVVVMAIFDVIDDGYDLKEDEDDERFI